MDFEQRYKLWCEKVTDEKLKVELTKMSNDQKTKENAFYKELEFGTGGLRGEIGVGTNCLNIYTIAKVTQGIADCMKHHALKTVAISCDSRINSDVFSKKVAEVFAANNIKAYISRELMPTPFLSFLTRSVKADIGVMVTASHNPAKYNGYKVYDSDGCQLTDERAGEMISYINQIDPFSVVTKDFNSYIKEGLISIADEQIEKDYIQNVISQSLNRAEGIKVTYSPLNGAGYRLVPNVLKMQGVEVLDIVPEQAYPDGNFTTCSYPNPEKPEALRLGLELAKSKKSDVLIATDPDADRVGIAVLHNNDYKLLTGNEVGVLLTDYVFKAKKQNGTLPSKPVLVKTIVSTALALKVAAEYNAESFDVLTGFKYIGDIIKTLEQKGEEGRFVLGFEESYGYLTGTYVRDKDAVVASMLIAEMISYHKKQGKTLVDRINEIYNRFGHYQNKLLTFEYPGAEGNAKMKQLLIELRGNLPTEIAGKAVSKTIDYLTQTEFKLPKSNILSFNAEDGTQVIIRPSGTEPLIKVYLTACANVEQNATTFEQLEAQVKSLLQKN